MSRTVRTVRQIPMDFMMPETTWSAPTELPDLRGRGIIAIDSETRDDGLASDRGPGWVYGAGHVAGVSMAAPGAPPIYVPVRHPDTPLLPHDAIGRWLSDHIHSGDVVVFQNAPYDLGWFSEEWGIKPPERPEDTIAAAYTLDEQRLSYSLDSLCSWLDMPGKDETLLLQAIDAIGGRGKGDLWRLPARYVGPYAEADAVRTLEVRQRLLPRLEAGGLLDAYHLECDLIPMVLAMRRRGIRIDTDAAEQVRTRLLERRDEALADIGQRLGLGRAATMEEINSPGRMTQFFARESVPVPKTGKGNPSFSNEWMEKWDHWLPQQVVVASKMHDAGEKFVGRYIMEYTHHGRIHAEIHQYRDDRGGTRTSRLSYSDPPLQQMPSRNPEIASLIRCLFLPEPGEVWGAPDYSQQEFRLMVHFASVCSMAGVDDAIRRYREDPNTDFHSLAADLTRLPRRKAKDVNFAKAFGAGVSKFALMTGMSEDEARQVMGQYDEELPFIKRLSEFCQKRAQERGFIRLIDGARVRFERWEPRYVDFRKQEEHKRTVGWPDMPTAPCSLEEARARTHDQRHFWYQERLQRSGTHKAMNSLIQGSAARQTKMAMRACWREGIVPLLQMHDELSASFGEEAPAQRMKQIMIDVVRLEVPVRVDLEFGPTWGHAKEDKKTGYGATFAEAMALVRR